MLAQSAAAPCLAGFGFNFAFVLAWNTWSVMQAANRASVSRRLDTFRVSHSPRPQSAKAWCTTRSRAPARRRLSQSPERRRLYLRWSVKSYETRDENAGRCRWIQSSTWGTFVCGCNNGTRIKNILFFLSLSGTNIQYAWRQTWQGSVIKRRQGISISRPLLIEINI